MTTQPTTLGAFSVSLAVKDIKASRDSYEKLDFEIEGGGRARHRGPAAFMLIDPDGNPILVDQHAPASLPRKKQN